MNIVVGSCPRCGSPIYAPSHWMATIPPPSTPSCGCFPLANGINTTSTEIIPTGLEGSIDDYRKTILELRGELAALKESLEGARITARQLLEEFDKEKQRHDAELAEAKEALAKSEHIEKIAVSFNNKLGDVTRKLRSELAEKDKDIAGLMSGLNLYTYRDAIVAEKELAEAQSERDAKEKEWIEKEKSWIEDRDIWIERYKRVRIDSEKELSAAREEAARYKGALEKIADGDLFMSTEPIPVDEFIGMITSHIRKIAKEALTTPAESKSIPERVQKGPKS